MAVPLDDVLPYHHHCSFDLTVNEDGEREFGASNGAVSLQIAQITGRFGPDCAPVSLVFYIDSSFIKHGIPVEPIAACYANIPRKYQSISWNITVLFTVYY